MASAVPGWKAQQAEAADVGTGATVLPARAQAPLAARHDRTALQPAPCSGSPRAARWRHRPAARAARRATVQGTPPAAKNTLAEAMPKTAKREGEDQPEAVARGHRDAERCRRPEQELGQGQIEQPRDHADGEPRRSASYQREKSRHIARALALGRDVHAGEGGQRERGEQRDLRRQAELTPHALDERRDRRRSARPRQRATRGAARATAAPRARTGRRRSHARAPPAAARGSRPHRPPARWTAGRPRRRGVRGAPGGTRGI